MAMDSAFSIDPKKIESVLYEIERSRGYIFRGDLWSPGYFTIDVDERESASLVASTESWEVMQALTPSKLGIASKTASSGC